MVSSISPVLKIPLSHSLQIDRVAQQELISAIEGTDGRRGAELAGEPSLRVGQAARLVNDIPDLWLSRDEVGTVISIWCFPISAYEIEFARPGDACRTRALVLSTDLRAEPTAGREVSRGACERET